MSNREETDRPQGLDRFTRNYLIFLGLIGIVVPGWWISSWNPRIGEINDILEVDPKLSAYVYPFRVISLEEGVATVSSPRSFEVPVIRFLGVIHPEMMAAQAELAAHQKRAGRLVREQADVDTVRWRLDKGWYAERGIYLN